MESLSETTWDVVISGTGLQQSLLALALSRSGKAVLHVDPNDYYGGPHAALSLQEADQWAEQNRAAVSEGGMFAAARVIRLDGGGGGLSFSRAYSLALAPQLIHAKSRLLEQLVSSKAYRQVEFLAVGSFYIFQPPSESEPAARLSRIPATREDVFSNTAIPARSKRALMKFLKFVLEYDAEPQSDVWRPRADEPLTEFLASEFRLEADLQAYIVTLTLILDGRISVEAGLGALNRHLTSMGVFGAGFAAVYPKWGGLSEIAQVACRAGAVGGAIYMLGTGIKDITEKPSSGDQTMPGVEVKLANDVAIKSRTLVQGSEKTAGSAPHLSRLVAVVGSDLSPVFAAVVDGAPTPAVAVVAFPPGSLAADDVTNELPVYATVHSSDTGECPVGQCNVYLSTLSTTKSEAILSKALSSLLASVAGDQEAPKCLYQLYYEQTGGTGSINIEGHIATFPVPSLSLAFDDSMLDPVQKAWDFVMGPGQPDDAPEYMKFDDREGAENEDEVYD